MKDIVKDVIFVVFMGMFGAAAGVGIISVLASISMPSYSDMLLTVREKADFDALQTGSLAFLGTHINVVASIIVVLAVIGFLFVLSELNPNFYSLKRARVKKAKAAIAAVGGIVLFFILIAAMARMPLAIFSGIYPTSQPGSFVFYGIFISIMSGMLWLLVGEMGWAGDLMSWGPGQTDAFTSVWPKAAASFVMGAVSGGVAYCMLLLFNWCFEKYFLLVAEVLGGSGEQSLHGWRLLCNALMVMLGFSFAVIAGFVTVLSARRLTVKARLMRLVVPVILLGIYGAIIAITYNDAVTRYDIKKKNLAEAAGVPEKGQAARTVVLFVPEKAAVQEWRMEAAGSGVLVPGNSYALTPENIRKIEDYLARRKDGSIFFFAGRDAVMKGYFKLWDTEKGNGQMFRNADSQLIARMVLLKRLSLIPATAENEKFLTSLADEKKWYAGKASCLRISEAFMHFGKAGEAKVWADKAMAKGADLTKSAFLSGPVVGRTSVTGALHLNGVPLAGRKVAVFSYRPKMKEIDPRSFGGFPAASRTTDEAGRFEFTNLGKGEYVLAVMVDKEQIPVKGSVSVENAPGIVAFTADNPTRILGTISITVK